MNQPELLLRTTLVEKYKENAILAHISDIEEMLEFLPGTWWNAYSQVYGVKIREFPYSARNGFFIDVDKRVCTHRFISKGIVRRDTILNDDDLTKIVPNVYRPTWFDYDDAVRCYSILITAVTELPNPVPVEIFGLYNSWGRISNKDVFHHPRLIKPTWELMKNKYM
ncbi:MAG: hypothetical protein OEZ01_12610 [Candidatus Heimdallarchaeota archaeon]|nr:hypothetical protein [Candidatus Heimdallarchaeota archaeon]MDH5646848.1 hypothetical protein [Candidatus Heimdallarchaeota archaeon]